VLRKALLAAALLVLLVAGGGIAVARGAPELSAQGPTSVTGTDASGVFEVGDRTIRQVRYDDDGTLRYTFRIANDGRLPVRVLGLADTQPETRLFTITSLTDGTVPAGEDEEFTLSLHMAGCETLSSRAGSFVTTIAVRTETAGMFEDTLDLELPEEVHTGSPREAFCPNSTATSRPPG
jgi:hypothetical protein